jgi:hypothetical protein
VSGSRIGGRHVVRITSADVGARVSVRAAVGEGADGPRYTDTVGTLESWDHGVLRIRRRDGEVVEVAGPAVVAGKVIPPARPPR